MNYSIKLNLSQLKNVRYVKKDDKDYICIPIKENYLYSGKNGLLLDLMAYQIKEQKFECSHFLKQSVPQEIYEKLNDDEKRGKIIGHLKPIVFYVKTEQSDANDIWD